MKNLSSKALTKPPFRNPEKPHRTKFAIPQLTNKDIIMKLSSLDIICASEHEEFFYEETDEAVPEGEPVGFDVDTEDGVDLVLFHNIYFKTDTNEYE